MKRTLRKSAYSLVAASTIMCTLAGCTVEGKTLQMKYDESHAEITGTGVDKIVVENLAKVLQYAPAIEELDFHKEVGNCSINIKINNEKGGYAGQDIFTSDHDVLYFKLDTSQASDAEISALMKAKKGIKSKIISQNNETGVDSVCIRFLKEG